MENKKTPATPKDVFGGGGKSEEGKKPEEGAMLKALLAQEEIDSLENPQPQPLRILGESSPNTHTYRLYSKGLVSEEIVKDVTKLVGGSGLFLCDSNGNSSATNKVLRDHRVLAQPEAVELAAIIQGLDWALKHGVKSIQFFCEDDSIILDYVIGKAAPPNESIVVAKLLKQLALLQTSFTSCQALPLLRSDDINSSLIKLARDAIASQTTWQREDGVVVEACVICYEDVPADTKFTVSGCFHRICFECMRNYITHSLRHRSRLICPNTGCKSELKPADCNRIADPDQLALMVERKAEETIDVSDRVYCPNPRCSILMSARGLPVVDPALTGARKCLGCGLRFCVNCKMEWHTKLSCAEFRKTKAYTKSGTAVFDATARELGLKKCRRCLCTVERAEGCKHMTCTFCKYDRDLPLGYCPKPSCNFLMSDRDLPLGFSIDPRQKSVARTCVECGLCFCKKCHVPWHYKKTCDEFKKSPSYLTSDAALFESLVKTQGWIKCPQCATVVQKNGGCQRISCRHCNHKFCYACGAACTRQKMSCNCSPEDGPSKMSSSSGESHKTRLLRA
ncbi:uncharacterized protein LOC103836882 [Brassica rapa]|uniref:uncharacterized protein LOC103836882 n=1 Tax=Brassica campestris TaxID=3711 RepID=UPI00142E0C42|nr:uncharacterized protein LOC103836882 [Brassica rapa]XP_033134813.1 uncharacterized protein LOC103836882 [Brassica rapa]XP_033134814.1 uncharacterized protein LOC103836882 [Brassica rapa]